MKGRSSLQIGPAKPVQPKPVQPVPQPKPASIPLTPEFAKILASQISSTDIVQPASAPNPHSPPDQQPEQPEQPEQPQPLTSTSMLSVLNIMTRKKTAPSKVTAGNIQQYGKCACDMVRSDPKDYYVINEDGQLVKISSLTCFSETINLFTIAKSVFSIPSLDCISVTPSGSFKGLFQSTVIPNMPHFTIDWKLNGKLNAEHIKQILSKRKYTSIKKNNNTK